MAVLQTGVVIGPYRVDGLLGRGGMATVYHAVDEALGRPVALKVLDPALASDATFAARFRREGALQASLDHPHIVPIYDAGSSEHGLYLAMALVPGTTLADRIAAGTLSARQALDVLGQVADALDAAHAAGLVHRDVKPRNVLVTDGDEAFVADFGLSALQDADGLTATGGLVGTAAYLAPEVIRGGPATPASDRYAFAAVAFECLTGSVVFPRPTHAAQLFAHTGEPVPRISVRRDDLPVALDAVFTRALSKAPDDRPASASALVASIREVLGDDDLAPAPPPRASEAAGDDTGPLPAPSAASRRRPRAAWLAGGLLLGAAAASAAWLILDKPADAPLPALAGAEILGSELRDPGMTRACDGRAVRPDSPGCTVIQTRSPGRTVVARSSGVVRRFALRDARGEFRLAVVRPRDGSFFQVALSDPAFIGDARVHAFDTDLPIEAGDLVALQVVSGSGFGVRAADGAATLRWSPWLRGAARAPDRTGDHQEIQLRVDYVPGEERALPRQVAGAAARALPPGETVERYRAEIVPGRPRQELRVVAAGPELALDLFHEGQREARLDLPGFVAGAGEIVRHELDTPDAAGAGAGIYLEYRRTDSARTSSHYVTLHERRLEYVG